MTALHEFPIRGLGYNGSIPFYSSPRHFMIYALTDGDDDEDWITFEDDTPILVIIPNQ